MDADAILGKAHTSDSLDELGCLTIVDLAGSEVRDLANVFASVELRAYQWRCCPF
jgi:hypothetical protein